MSDSTVDLGLHVRPARRQLPYGNAQPAKVQRVFCGVFGSLWRLGKQNLKTNRHSCGWIISPLLMRSSDVIRPQLHPLGLGSRLEVSRVGVNVVRGKSLPSLNLVLNYVLKKGENRLKEA